MLSFLPSHAAGGVDSISQDRSLFASNGLINFFLKKEKRLLAVEVKIFFCLTANKIHHIKRIIHHDQLELIQYTRLDQY